MELNKAAKEREDSENNVMHGLASVSVKNASRAEFSGYAEPPGSPVPFHPALLGKKESA